LSNLVPEQKDTVIAIFGASVALAGLLLVFCGFLFGRADNLPSSTGDSTIEKYRKAGKAGVFPFLATLLVAALSLTWLLCPIDWIYWTSVWAFFFTLVVTALYGGLTIWSFA